MGRRQRSDSRPRCVKVSYLHAPRSGAFALLGSGILYGQKRSDLIAQFGNARIQTFWIDEHIRLSVEYTTSGYLRAAQIASPDYRPEELLRERDMENADVDRLLDAIVPGIAETADGVFAVVTGKDMTWSVQYNSFTLNRSYRGLDKNNGKTIIATLTADVSGISEPMLEAQYGSPEQEVFSVGPALALSVSYGPKGSARSVAFRQPTSLLDKDLEARAINSDDVAQFINEFVPSSQRVGIPERFQLLSGSNRIETSVYEGVTLTRAYHADELLSAVVNWK